MGGHVLQGLGSANWVRMDPGVPQEQGGPSRRVWHLLFAASVHRLRREHAAGLLRTAQVRQRKQLFTGIQLGHRFPRRDASAIARSDSKERSVRHGLHKAGVWSAGSYPELDHSIATATG